MGKTTEKAGANALPGNVVLYRRDGADATGKPLLFPLFSCDGNDALLAAKIMAKLSSAMNACDVNGIPHSSIAVVHEYREADEAGRLTKTEYAFFDPMTRERGAVVASLDALFKGE